MTIKLTQPFTRVPFLLAISISIASATLAIAGQGSIESKNTNPTQIMESKPKAAISNAIKEYAIARYAGDVQGVRSRLHPALASRTISDTYWGQPSDEWVRPLTFEGTSFLKTSVNRVLLDNPNSGRVEVTVHDIAQITAAATLISEDRIEMLHLILFNDQWLIADIVTNFLSNPGDKATAKTTRHDESITKILTDYCVGFYEIDGQKVQNTCHPILSKRAVEHNDEGNFDFLQQITYEEIKILGETFNKSFGFEPDARCVVEIYEVRGDIAIAKMTGTVWFDYFQLLKVDNEWTIINIMFESLPRDQWEST